MMKALPKNKCTCKCCMYNIIKLLCCAIIQSLFSKDLTFISDLWHANNSTLLHWALQIKRKISALYCVFSAGPN